MAASDAIPVPRKNTAFRFYFAIRNPSDSTLITTWAGQDSEVSLDGAAYSDCTNEATEIGTTGTGYIDLTAGEMNADCVLLKVTVTNTGAVPLVFVLYPETAGDYRVADTQKVDVDTIKTQTLTAAAGITFGVYVGGTEAAAPASTALSTATWTGTLATDLATTNTTVSTNLDAAITSRMATYTQPTGFLAATFPTDPADQSEIIAATDAILTAVGTRLAASAYTAPPSASTISTQVAADLEAAHGAGSWQTATGFSTHSAADVWAVGTRTITGGSLTTSPPTAAAIADAVWDEARADHVTAGTFGENVIAELDSTTTTKINSILEDTGTTLPAQISGIAGGSGTGARTVTITVNDGATALQNATVRMTEGVNTYTASTNASGVAVFNLDDATYTVGISKAGYSYAGTTIVVDGTETATYSMTAVSVTPGTGDITTGYLTCLDEEGVAEQNVSVRCQVVQIPASGTGFAYDSAVQIATSDADGLVEFPMIKGARYLVWRGSIKPPAGITPILISAAAGSTTALGSLIGE